MSSSDRVLTDEEWKEIYEAWTANHEAITKVLKKTLGGYKPKSRARRRLADTMEREAREFNLIREVITRLQKMDEILHRHSM